MNEDEESPSANSLRDLFPGHFPPDRAGYKRALTQGLVVLDANALLELYRFNEAGRQEYLAALRLLGDRLWVPHRAAQEFMENRFSVIVESAASPGKFEKELSGLIQQAVELIQGTGKRRGLTQDQVKAFVTPLTATADHITSKLAELHSFPFTPAEAVQGDPILDAVVELLRDKLGDPLADLAAAEKEARRRIEQKIPPGYADASKGSRACGDYLLWLQTMLQAKEIQKPILLISGEQKNDWIRREHGHTLGPRPELVAEMRAFAGQEFYLSTVQTFLIRAKEHLEAEVSETTVEQAAEKPRRKRLFNLSETVLPALEQFALAVNAYQTHQDRMANDPAYREEFERLRRETAKYSTEQARQAAEYLRTPQMQAFLAQQGIPSVERPSATEPAAESEDPDEDPDREDGA